MWWLTSSCLLTCGASVPKAQQRPSGSAKALAEEQLQACKDCISQQYKHDEQAAESLAIGTWGGAVKVRRPWNLEWLDSRARALSSARRQHLGQGLRIQGGAGNLASGRGAAQGRRHGSGAWGGDCTAAVLHAEAQATRPGTQARHCEGHHSSQAPMLRARRQQHCKVFDQSRWF